MRILITGHKGFIGQNMMRFIGVKHDVMGYEWGDGEVKLDNVDRVIHLGAISSTRCTDWDALMAQNIQFSADLTRECAKRRIPIQIASSASVYGPKNRTFLETDKLNPSNLYAKSKAQMEQECLEIGGQVQIFRYFNVFGPYEDHKGDQASPHTKFAKEAIDHGRITVFEGSDEFCRDFVPVKKVCAYHEAFFEIEESGIWNIGTGQPESFLSVAQKVAKTFGAEIIEVAMPEDLRAAYQAFTCANMVKAKRSLYDARKQPC